MARIKISELSQNREVSYEDLKRVIGGISLNFARSYAVMNTKGINSERIYNSIEINPASLPGMDW